MENNYANIHIALEAKPILIFKPTLSIAFISNNIACKHITSMENNA